MATTTNPETETDPVRRYTSADRLEQIERRIRESVGFYGAQGPEMIQERIETLEREWSVERFLQVRTSVIGLLGIGLAVSGKRRAILLTLAASGALLFHGIRGFDPGLLILRRIGIRTRSEIDREILALKVIRGDFADVPRNVGIEEVNAGENRMEQILEAVDK